jgi:hypothetical protein
MLDLIILIVLVIRIVKYAKVKKQSPVKWGILLALNWFMFELLGIAMASHLLNIQYSLDLIQLNPWYFLLLSVFGIGCGFLGYFMTRMMMDRAVV